MKQSKAWEWNKADTKKFLLDTLRVLGPYILVIIPVVLQQIPSDYAYASIIIFILQRIRSAVELYLSGK